MLSKIWSSVDMVVRQAAHLERHHWIILSVIVLGLGIACMRGFGSRDSY